MKKLNLENIFQHSPTPTSVIEANDPEFRFVKVNDAYCRMTQRSESELIGKALFEAFPANPDEKKPTGPERLLQSFRRVIKTRQPDELETIRYDIVLDDGQYKEVYWRVINTPVLSEDGEVEYITNSASCITEQVISQRINNMMLNNSEDSFVLVDRDLMVKNFNRQFAQNYLEIFGRKVEKGQSILDLTLPERKEALKERYVSVLKGETISDLLKVPTKSGGTRYFDIKYKPARDEHDEIVGSFVSLIEKTAEHKAQEKYQQVVEHSTNMFFKHDAEGVLTYVSPQSKYFLGFSPEKAMRKWTEFITDHPLNKIGEQHTRKALETGETQPPYELQLKTADNRIIWVEIHEAPVVEDGNVTGIVGSLSDITERKTYEEQLQKSLERYDFASKATRDAIYDWDMEEDTLHWGDGLKTLFGYDTGNQVNSLKLWSDNVHPSDIDRVQEELDQTLNDPNLNQVEYEYRFRRENGEYAYVHENGYVIRNHKGKAIRMIGALRDVTESKQAELQTHLQHQVAQFFKHEDRLHSILDHLLHYLAEYEKFSLAEIWLVSATKNHLNLMASFARNNIGRTFYKYSRSVNKFGYGEGLPGLVWKNRSTETWDNLSENPAFIRNEAAKESELKSATAFPLFHNDDFIGVLLLGSEEPAQINRHKVRPYKILQDFLGAEIRRKQREEEMQLLFKSSPDILAIAASNNRFIKVNPGFCELMGYSEEELTSQNFQTFIHPDDLDDTNKEYEETVTGERNANNYINRWITRSGDTRYISWRSSEVFGEDNFVFAFGRDVTDRKIVEQQIIETNKKLKTAQEIASLGYWELNLKSRDLYWSDEVFRIWGLDPTQEPLVFEDFRNTVHPEDLDAFDAQQSAAISGEEALDIEHRIILPDGTVKWVHEIGKIIHNKKGQPILFEGTVQDITERKKARKALEKLNRDLELHAQELAASNAELEQFAYVASHDLQEPLRMVTSFLTQLDKKYSDDLDERAKKYIHFAVDGAQRMRQIILDLLNYSRLNQDKKQRESVDLNVILEEVKTLERKHIEETGGEIITESLPVVYANPGPIKQVFQNLINNGLKYHKEGASPKVEITYTETDTHWEFKVSDNGIGIRKEFQDGIFQIFQRLHTRDEYSGTGIGLAITKKIVERHGGKIWLESEEGKGSTFYFTLSKEEAI
ncbi:PAS domain S-box protein [Gracilimonas amylolytica]|uniref:PAS domain S-box protein n=1 Tax=Gracilimonas amylolytica TaxID=1749045 RepID=UPI000CD82276|nr:PAS domain S-box protein [Gracilimonas amylolytica]